MQLETWDRTSLKEQNNTFGRFRDNGVAQEKEFNEAELFDRDKNALLPENSHVFLSKNRC